MYLLLCIICLAMMVGFCSKAKEQKVEEIGNPFFAAWDTPHQVPPFEKIKVEHYLPAFEEGIKQNKAEIEAIANNTEAATFANTVEAMAYSGELLDKVGGVFYVLNGSMTNDAMQATAQKLAPMLSKHDDDIMLNAKLFQRIKAIHDQKDTLELNTEQKKLLDFYYKRFVRGGANLDAAQQEELRKINSQLALLTLKFSENILKENNGFELVIDKKEDLAGLPGWLVDAGAEVAKERGHQGKWVYTLHKPSMLPFLQYAENRDLREKIYMGYINRGNNDNELDNKKNIIQILSLRLKKARLLGFDNHAAFKLAENMSKKPENVYKLLEQIWKPALDVAKQEVKEMQAIIDKEGKNFKLASWDWWYYAEKLKKAKYDLDEESIKPYFKLENVRDGAFYVANKLYGISFVERTDIPTYHKDAKVFEVQEADGSHIGILYTDYFPRASKRGGAWMNNFRQQYKKGDEFITPVITNNGNFTKPTANIPALLTPDEVETLFHEFGHGLHGLLSNGTYQQLSGLEVPLDFVELPSQIMEHWCFEPEVLKVYAKHYKTGEVIPQELLDKIKKSQYFNQGFITVEYLAAALLDMDWHTLTEGLDAEDFDVLEFEKKSLERIGLIPEIISRYRSTYFNHIFSSMYSAGYYSYIWAEVLDADAFEAFQETSLFDQETAKAFREHILSKGGIDDPMEMYKRFRGKEPGIDPLLKNRGLK